MTEQHFEMLWNCDTCGVTGLLAKSQRHCPSCGNGQNAAKRYFPEAGQEVVINGHTYQGADWTCSYCETPNGITAAFCTNCGAPQAGSGSKEVKRIEDAASAPPPLLPPSATPLAPLPAGGHSKWKLIFGALLAGLWALAFQFFSTHDETVTVAGKSWQKEIEIERFQATTDSVWCSSLPNGAYNIRRTSEVKEQRKVEAGQACTEKRIDAGDGTFTKKQECVPKYRDEPVYADKCYFTINRWTVARTSRANGDQLVSPVWPVTHVAPSASAATVFGASQTLGAEREGARSEIFNVELKSAKGEVWTCATNVAAWQNIGQGQTLKVEVRGTGGPVCDSLR